MKIKKGQLLTISHSRKGKFTAVATKDFDSDEVDFFPVAVALESVGGINTVWEPGGEIPCRARFARILKVQDPSEV